MEHLNEVFGGEVPAAVPPAVPPQPSRPSMLPTEAAAETGRDFDYRACAHRKGFMTKRGGFIKVRVQVRQLVQRGCARLMRARLLLSGRAGSVATSCWKARSSRTTKAPAAGLATARRARWVLSCAAPFLLGVMCALLVEVCPLT